jgi:hypothetical protein
MWIKLKRILLLVFIVVGITILSQCHSTPDGEFDFDTQRMIDTIVRNEKRILEVEMDSICALRMDSLVGIAIDSVKEIRISEILDILSEESLK